MTVADTLSREEVERLLLDLIHKEEAECGDGPCARAEVLTDALQAIRAHRASIEVVAQPVTPKQQAVLDAAMAVVGLWEADRGAETYDAMETLVGAVRALREPQPVRPEDVKPGTRFRFAGWVCSGVYTLVRMRGHQWVYWTMEDGLLRKFEDDDRIIPVRGALHHCRHDPPGDGRFLTKTLSSPRNGAFAPFVRPTPQSDPWRHDRGRIVS